MNKHLRNLIIFVCLGIAYSCATPSSPTGGPRDEEGPKIIKSEPKTGTVNFKDDQIVLHFSEFVERSSLNKALTIEPQVGLNYKIDWGRKSAAIEFQNAIPDSTTLIVTIGTDFSDLNGNSMAEPFKVAVSTGPEIDKGKLIGKVLDARTGKGDEGKRVLLYRAPVDLSLPANYIGESDTSGIVKFSYLAEGKYKAFWLDDRNRNRVWDTGRERAQPFNKEFVTLQKAGEDTLGTLFIANSDTSKPELQGVGLFSSQRLRLRFSESIKLIDRTNIRIEDTTGTPFSSGYPLYISPQNQEQYVLFAQSEKPLPPEQSFRLLVQNIADVAGNLQPRDTLTFTGSAQEDTTAQRVIGTSINKGIFPDEPVEITYAKPITKASIRDSLKVAAGDSMHSPWEHLQIEHNKVLISPDSAWKDGVSYELRVWDPVLEDYRSISPTVWQDRDLGGLHITFADTTLKEASQPTHLTLTNEFGNIVADTTFTGEIELTHLAPVSHQLKLFQDLNGNGEWDYGQLTPFEAPEPYYVQNDIVIQKGLTADLSVTFEQ